MDSEQKVEDNNVQPHDGKPHVICSGGHTWDKLTGIREAGRPHIGIKSKWVRTCQKCGKREVFSSGMFNGWFSE